MGRTVTLVCAPNIPASELSLLKAHLREGAEDPDYTVIVNYDLYIQSIEFIPGVVNIFTAPKAPSKEIKALHESLATEDLVVVNFDVSVRSIDSESLITPSRPLFRDGQVLVEKDIVTSAYERAEAMDDLDPL